MDQIERFRSVVHMEEPDYWPLLAAHALGTPHLGGLHKLHREGLPEHVCDIESWCAYWGECTFDVAGSVAVGAPGIRSTSRAEDGFEIIEYETGARTRQVLDNAITYSMPDFQVFDVRDRASWEHYRALTAPTALDDSQLEAMVRRFSGRSRPLAVHCGGTWGVVRNCMGPERALTALYEEPDLVHDMIGHFLGVQERFVFPVLQALRPEIVMAWEDSCYNRGMLIGPDHFREFCAPYYRRVSEVARGCGAELLFVDSDGKVADFIPLMSACGFNGLMPMEQVCGNDPVDYRDKTPGFIFLGGIEKEIASTGNSHRIETELAPKVRGMLTLRGCFPMFDHGLSTNVGFEEHCRCMTRLHELCGSAHLALGDFPRS